jgi:hypothetical protein
MQSAVLVVDSMDEEEDELTDDGPGEGDDNEV